MHDESSTDGTAGMLGFTSGAPADAASTPAVSMLVTAIVRAAHPEAWFYVVAPAIFGSLSVWLVGQHPAFGTALSGLVAALLIFIGAALLESRAALTPTGDIVSAPIEEAARWEREHYRPIFLRAGVVCFVLAALAGIPAVHRGGIPVAVIGVVCVAASVALSTTPFPLSATPIGDVVVAAALGPALVAAQVLAQTRHPNSVQMDIGFAFGVLTLATILAIRMRSAESDRLRGRKTLRVLLGARGTQALIVLCIAAAYALLLAAGLPLRAPHGLLLGWLSLPFAVVAATSCIRAAQDSARRLAAQATSWLYTWFAVFVLLGTALNIVYLVVRVK